MRELGRHMKGSLPFGAAPRPSARRVCGATLGLVCVCALSGVGVTSDCPLARGRPLQGRKELPAGFDAGAVSERLVRVTSAVRESRATIADGFVSRPMLHTSLRARAPPRLPSMLR